MSDPIERRLKSGLHWQIRRLYMRWVRPHLHSYLARQRARMLYFVWGYWRIARLRALPLRDKLLFLRASITVDWSVPHAHEPSEITRVLEALAIRRARAGEVMVECGCWNGGSTAKFSVVCAALGYGLVVYDSFQGVEPIGPEEEGRTDFSGQYAASLGRVCATVGRFGHAGVVRYVPGWFADTMDGRPVGAPVRIAYVDCDLAKGTREAIASIRPALTEDGAIFSQDFHIGAVRRALGALGTVIPLTRQLARLDNH